MHINVLALTAILKLTRAHMQPHRETNTRNKVSAHVHMTFFLHFLI